MEIEIDLKSITAQVASIAKEAGNYIAKEGLGFQQAAIEYKDVNNVVSYVDKQAELLIVEKLKALNVKAGFITEEDTASTSDRDGLNWIIDPLDGTANFIHGLPHYAVSLALARGKEVLIGVVYEICKDNTFHTFKGGGAYCNNQKLQVSKATELGQSLMATGFPYYKFEEMSKYIKVLESLMQKTHGLRRFGSAALDLAYVAAGYYDGFFEYNLNSWDMAAGVLLVEEAGGKVSDFKNGDEYLFRGDIIAANQTHKVLLSEIQKHW